MASGHCEMKDWVPGECEIRGGSGEAAAEESWSRAKMIVICARARGVRTVGEWRSTVGISLCAVGLRPLSAVGVARGAREPRLVAVASGES